MESFRSEEARRNMRHILSAVERGEHVTIQRYDTDTAVMVPVGWYQEACRALGIPGESRRGNRNSAGRQTQDDPRSPAPGREQS